MPWICEADFCNQVYIEHGTLCWPGDIDLDPVVRYAWVLNLPIKLATAIPA